MSGPCVVQQCTCCQFARRGVSWPDCVGRATAWIAAPFGGCSLTATEELYAAYLTLRPYVARCSGARLPTRLILRHIYLLWLGKVYVDHDSIWLDKVCVDQPVTRDSGPSSSLAASLSMTTYCCRQVRVFQEAVLPCCFQGQCTLMSSDAVE